MNTKLATVGCSKTAHVAGEDGRTLCGRKANLKGDLGKVRVLCKVCKRKSIQVDDPEFLSIVRDVADLIDYQGPVFGVHGLDHLKELARFRSQAENGLGTGDGPLSSTTARWAVGNLVVWVGDVVSIMRSAQELADRRKEAVVTVNWSILGGPAARRVPVVHLRRHIKEMEELRADLVTYSSPDIAA